MKTLIRKHALITFFVLSYVLMYGAYFVHVWLNPGEPVPLWSPVWFVGVFSPTISAVFVAWVIGGLGEVRRLFGGFTRWKVGWFWYLAATFLLWAPFVIAIVYIALGNQPAGTQGRLDSPRAAVAGVLPVLFRTCLRRGWLARLCLAASGGEIQCPGIQPDFGCGLDLLAPAALLRARAGSDEHPHAHLFIVMRFSHHIPDLALQQHARQPGHHGAGALGIQPDRDADHRAIEPDARHGLLHDVWSLAFLGRCRDCDLLQAEVFITQACCKAAFPEAG